ILIFRTSAFACYVSTFTTAIAKTTTNLNFHPFIITDTEVTCVHNQSCILPCMFHMDSVSIVHWIHMTDGEPHAHSYNNQNQLSFQNPEFRGRTSLFRDQLSRGNASLLLTGVKVQDEGKYKCFVFTENGKKELYVYLKIDGKISFLRLFFVSNQVALTLLFSGCACSSSLCSQLPSCRQQDHLQLRWDLPSA
uniref:Ig-like domain-containing protein n=1 Tax=Xiphophorus maculatus TaxID=8083 RepID=A0A3B5R2X2_XIPMA